MEQTEAATLQNTHKYYVLFLLFLVSVLNYADRIILAVLLEPIKSELSLSDTQLGLLSGIAFAIFYATLGLPIARLVDKGYKRPILTFSISLWSIMTALCGQAYGFYSLFLARIGVSVGEAGATPSAHAYIWAFFPQQSRGKAIAIFSFGATIGTLAAYALGGMLEEKFGWRSTFFFFALPGLILSLLIYTTISLPKKSHQPEIPKNLYKTLNEIWLNKNFKYLIYAVSFYSILTIGVGQWLPSFMIRTFDMTLKEAGANLGGVILIASVIGTLMGGYVADILARKNKNLLTKASAIILSVVFPITLIMYLINNLSLYLILLFIAVLLQSTTAPIFLLAIHKSIEDRVRAVAIAIFLFATSLIGMGLGPLIIGFISDILMENNIQDSLRYGLLTINLFALPAIYQLVKAKV